MDHKVQRALSASLDKFALQIKEDVTAVQQELFDVFNSEHEDFMDKIAAFDAVFDDHGRFEELREVYFDLLMINFFASDVKLQNEDYLESEEWESIEDETIDRGTELLNLLLYINECHDENIKPELDDFLKEFLLVEEDDFQDEFEIYEDLISNQQLADSSIEDICSHAGMIEINEEMEELFVPFMCFFNQPEGKDQAFADLDKFSQNKEFDVAVYALITAFNTNK